MTSRWSNPISLTDGDRISQRHTNRYIYWNMREQAPARVNARGDTVVGAGANELARVPVGIDNFVLCCNTATSFVYDVGWGFDPCHSDQVWMLEDSSTSEVWTGVSNNEWELEDWQIDHLDYLRYDVWVATISDPGTPYSIEVRLAYYDGSWHAIPGTTCTRAYLTTHGIQGVYGDVDVRISPGNIADHVFAACGALSGTVPLRMEFRTTDAGQEVAVRCGRLFVNWRAAPRS